MKKKRGTQDGTEFLYNIRYTNVTWEKKKTEFFYISCYTDFTQGRSDRYIEPTQEGASWDRNIIREGLIRKQISYKKEWSGYIVFA